MAMGIGKSMIDQSTAIIPRTKLKIYLLADEIGSTTRYEMRNTWAANSGLLKTWTLCCISPKVFS